MAELSRASSFLLISLVIAADARAQEEDFEDVEADEAPEPEASVELAPAQADARFDEIMQLNAAPAKSPPAEFPSSAEEAEAAATPSVRGRAEVPLGEYEKLIESQKMRQREGQRNVAPAVVLGAAEYSGSVRQGALELSVALDVTLDSTDRHKFVPLVGESVVLVGASESGVSIPVTRRGGYHVWITRKRGEARVLLKILVPARGPRGSIEFDFAVARTPVTKLTCRFPSLGLEPRVDAAVESRITSEGPSTALLATLRPTTRIHLIGFKDLGSESDTMSKIFAESSNLLSVDDGALELFSVIRYTILYGAAKDFVVQVPPDVDVVSAEGEGAFRYSLERAESGTVIRGETAFPIRGDYEISIRLRRETAKGTLDFVAPLPRAVGVEREQGHLGIEVPGKLKLEETRRDEIVPVDVRQLPPEMVDSAVSPILLAYRYHSPAAKVSLRAERLPEKDAASASIDNVAATTVLSPEGREMTRLLITLRNRARPSLVLDVDKATEVRSSLLDDQPVKPSRDEEGRLMVPLKRSAGGDRMEPFTLEIVLESSSGAFGLFGRKSLDLPAVDLPISSLEWRVFAPARNSYSALKGEISSQSLAGEASWHQPPAAPGAGGGAPFHGGPSADSGAMPVRMELPETGTQMDHVRYWIPGGAKVPVRFSYVRSWLLTPLRGLLVLGVAIAFVALTRARISRRLRAAAGILAATLAAFANVLAPALFAGLLAVLWANGSLTRVWAELTTAWSTLPERFKAREKGPPRGFLGWVGRLALLAVACVLLLALAVELAPLLSILRRPLEG